MQQGWLCETFMSMLIQLGLIQFRQCVIEVFPIMSVLDFWTTVFVIYRQLVVDSQKTLTKRANVSIGE